jgi:hypothetical protein
MAVNYGTQGPTATAISIVFAVMTVIVISLRLFSRIVIVQSTGLDDSKFTLPYQIFKILTTARL